MGRVFETAALKEGTSVFEQTKCRKGLWVVIEMQKCVVYHLSAPLFKENTYYFHSLQLEMPCIVYHSV